MAQASASAVHSSPAAHRELDRITPALVGIFVLSGASGLIYQIAWVRLLSLSFGVTIHAVSIVVAAFMGGLALGSYLGGRAADRTTRPILWYAGAEVLIGVVGLLSPAALSLVQTVYVGLHPSDVAGPSPLIVLLRFGLAALVLIVPTALMGATLPLMVKGSLTMAHGIGARVSWLYASNTTGAILGTLGAGFLLIGVVGVSGTIRIAALLNLAAAAGAVLVGARARGEPPEKSALTDRGPISQAVPHPGTVSRTVRTLVYVAFAAQGFASLAYEVVWFRILAVLLDGSTYAFSIVLATVLLGIALGSALVGPWIARPRPWLPMYALLQAGVAALALLGVVLFAHIYDVIGAVQPLGPFGALARSHFGWMGLVALLTVLPPTLLLGASFPIAVRIVVGDAAHAGQGLGLLYAGNTAGAILGSWAGGFLLVPVLGTQRSIELLAAISAMIAVALALGGGGQRRRTLATVLALLLLGFGMERWLAPGMFEQMAAGRFPQAELVWYAEGQETSVIVARDRPTGFLEMYLNAQGQASDDPFVVRFHQLLGHLPMVLHPDPQDVLIVGLGGGATAGALAVHQPRRFDVVELAEAVPAAATLFNHVNGNVLSYPRLSMKIDDGRNHLLLTGQRYDVITADAINPRGAGAGMLYSAEYYQLARRALKPGGIVAQWLEVNPQNVDSEAQRKLMARTFLSSFPHASLWGNGALMIGSGTPLTEDGASLRARWSTPGGRDFSRVLAGTEFASGETLASSFVYGDAEFRTWAGEGPIMTDDRPFVEFFLSLPGGSTLERWRGRFTR